MNFQLDLSQPWALKPSAVAHLAYLIEMAAAKSAPATAAPKAPPYQVRNGVALISISGVLLGSCPDWISSNYDVTSCERVAENLGLALKDSTVNDIWFPTNSPGGQVSGCCELSSLIADAGLKKPTQTFAHGLLASGAYWLASATGSITATPSTIVGSIGVIAIHADQSQANAAAGIRLEVFRSGPLKAGGIAGTSLTPEQRASMQSTIDDSMDLFQRHVLTHRPGVDASVFDGGVFVANRAQQLGLIDGTALSLDGHLTQKQMEMPSTNRPIKRNSAHSASTQIMSLEAQWNSSPALQAEFLDFKTFKSYMTAGAAGRIRDFGRQENGPADRRESTPSAGGTLESQWENSPSLRPEFLDFKTYASFAKASARGAFRDLSRVDGPVTRAEFDSDRSYESFLKAQGRVKIHSPNFPSSQIGSPTTLRPVGNAGADDGDSAQAKREEFVDEKTFQSYLRAVARGAAR